MQNTATPPTPPNVNGKEEIDEEHHTPPPLPPPLLSPSQILTLAQQGHLPLPLPPHLRDLYARLHAVSRQFFDLSTTTKSTLFSSSSSSSKESEAEKEEGRASGTAELGYVDIPGEKEYVSFRAAPIPTSTSTIAVEGKKEIVDASLTLKRDEMDALSTDLSTLISTIWSETYTLLYRILCDLSWAMDIDPHSHDKLWTQILDGTNPIPRSVSAATTTFLRVFRYAATLGTADSHVDLGLLTLCVPEGPGLQVRVRRNVREKEKEEQHHHQQTQERVEEDKEWIEYPAPTLLVGKTLRTLSGGLIKAGVHRVVGSEGGRSSVVYALRPSTRHEVDLSAFPGGGGQQGTNMVHMGELWRRMWTGAYNVNAPAEVREKQKEKARLAALAATAAAGGKNDEMKPADGAYDMTNTVAAITG